MICAAKRGRVTCAVVRGRAEETDASQLVTAAFSPPTDAPWARASASPINCSGQKDDRQAALGTPQRSHYQRLFAGDWLSALQNLNAMFARCPLAAGAAIRPSCRWCRRSGRRTLDGTNARSGCLRWSTGNVLSTPPFFNTVGAPSMWMRTRQISNEGTACAGGDRWRSFVEGRSDIARGTRRPFLQPLCNSTPQPFSASRGKYPSVIRLRCNSASMDRTHDI